MVPSRKRRERIRRHVCVRARERWDVLLTPEDVGGLNAVIRRGLGRLVCDWGRGQIYWVTTLCGRRLPVVWRGHYNCIVTVLPGAHRALVVRT